MNENYHQLLFSLMPIKKICILIVPLLFHLGCTGVDENGELQERLAEYERQNELLQEKVSALQASIDSLARVRLNAMGAVNYWFDEQAAFQGIELDTGNPEKFIVNALRERSDLIPLEPVLGGTMRFVKIQLLGEKWIIADYEDGHIRGRSIFSYRFNKDGEITFRRIASSSG